MSQVNKVADEIPSTSAGQSRGRGRPPVQASGAKTRKIVQKPAGMSEDLPTPQDFKGGAIVVDWQVHVFNSFCPIKKKKSSSLLFFVLFFY